MANKNELEAIKIAIETMREELVARLEALEERVLEIEQILDEEAEDDLMNNLN